MRCLAQELYTVLATLTMTEPGLSVPVFDPLTSSSSSQCNAVRSSVIAFIRLLCDLKKKQAYIYVWKNTRVAISQKK